MTRFDVIDVMEIKFWFSEKATKFEKILHGTFDKSVVFCARYSVLVKKLTKIFKNKCGQVVLYKLYCLRGRFRKLVWPSQNI